MLKKSILTLISFSFLLVVSSARAELLCSDIYATEVSAKNAIERLLEVSDFLVPPQKNAVAGDHLMFGFESEYLIKDSGRILSMYGPQNMNKAEWLKMDETQHIDWLLNRLKDKKLADKESGLVKINEEQRYKFLPEQPIVDDTGNLELIIGPIDTYEAWLQQMLLINRTFGVGSQQSMVSIPLKFLFPQGRDVQSSVEEILGTFNFLHEYDSLERMEEGALRYQQNPNRLVLRTFAHPFLGPITKAKQDYLKAQLWALSRGEKVDFDVWTAKSSKFVGSTTARPDIGAAGGRMGAEVRDAYMDQQKLIDKTQRISAILMGDRTPLSAFKDLQAVDTKIDFEKFDPAAQKMLAHIFPVRMDQTFGAADEVFALEVYRQFSYPLKDWSEDLKSLHRDDLKTKVKVAQDWYLNYVNELGRIWSKGDINDLQASTRVQGACALFAQNAELFQVFKKSYDQIMNQISLDLIKRAEKLHIKAVGG